MHIEIKLKKKDEEWWERLVSCRLGYVKVDWTKWVEEEDLTEKHDVCFLPFYLHFFTLHFIFLFYFFIF